MSESNMAVKSTAAAALLDSMHVVRQALTKPNGLSPEQLDQRIHEWQLAMVDLIGDTVKGAELTTLYEIIGVLNSSLDLTNTLGLVMDSLIHLTGAERGCLMLLDEKSGLEIKAAQNFDSDCVDAFDMKLSHTVVQEAIETKHPVLTTNAQRDPRFSGRESVIDYQLRSIICVPLHVRERMMGALYLDNRMRNNVFSPQDLPILTAFASQAAIAIENARLYTTTDQALAAKIEELTALQQIDLELNTSLDLERVLGLTLSWAMQATEAEKGTLSALNDTGAVEKVARAGDEEMEQPTPDIIQLAIRSQGPCVIAGRRMLIPIRCENRTVGLLDLRCNKDTRFQPEQTQFADQLAGHAAFAIENARLYEQVRQANQDKAGFVSLVVHKLRTPMTSIRGYADMLEQGTAGQLTPDQTEFIHIIKRNVERLQLLITDLHDITRIESEQMFQKLKPTALADALENIRRAVQEPIEIRSQQLTIESPENLPHVLAAPVWLEQILSELLENARKYTPKGGQIHVRVQFDGDYVRCSVSDTGIGISEADQAHLFEKFFRSKDPMVQEMHGTGLGLCIVKGLVELQGGEFRIESQPGEGTTCTFTIPVAKTGQAEE